MSYSKMSNQGKFILVSWAILALLCFTGGVVIGATCFRSEGQVPMVDETTRITAPVETHESIVTEPEPELISETEIVTEPIPEYTVTSLGEFRLTAYCSCEKCCDHWATNRPLDEYGNPIVYTASGAVAKQGVTVAADTNVLPFGTVIVIGGHEYIVQDRGGGIKGNSIDVYFDNHEDAKVFGLFYQEIFIKEKNNVT